MLKFDGRKAGGNLVMCLDSVAARRIGTEPVNTGHDKSIEPNFMELVVREEW